MTRLSTISPNVFYVTRVIFSTLVFNNASLMTGNRTARWTSGAITHPNTNYVNSNIKVYNSIYGLQGIHLKNQALLNYRTIIADGTMNAVIPSIWYGLNYLFLTFTLCPSGTDKLMVSQNLCYDVCPIGYYTDGYNECQLCANFACYECSSGFVLKDGCTEVIGCL